MTQETDALVERCVSAMEDDPFIDDTHLHGTTQQGQRFAHYVGLLIPIVVARCAEVARSFEHGGENYAFYSDLFEALPDIARAIEEVGRQ